MCGSTSGHVIHVRFWINIHDPQKYNSLLSPTEAI